MGVWVAGFIGWFIGAMTGAFIMALMAANAMNDPYRGGEAEDDENKPDSGAEKESGTASEDSQYNG